MALAQQLIKDGYVDEALQFMELEIELAPGKVWILRKTAEACLGNGRTEKALEWAEKGLALKPEDEKLIGLMAEAERDLKRGE